MQLPAPDVLNENINAITDSAVKNGVARMWHIINTLESEQQKTEVISTFLKLVNGEYLIESTEWIHHRGFLEVGRRVRVTPGTYPPDSPSFPLNGKVGTIIGMRRGFATVSFDSGDAEHPDFQHVSTHHLDVDKGSISVRS